MGHEDGPVAKLPEGATVIMRHRTILEYRDYRYLKLAALIVAAVIFAYGCYWYSVV